MIFRHAASLISAFPGHTRAMVWSWPPGTSSRGPTGTLKRTVACLSVGKPRHHVARRLPIPRRSRGRAIHPKGEVGRYRFPPMVVAEVKVRGDIDLELHAHCNGSMAPGSHGADICPTISPALKPGLSENHSPRNRALPALRYVTNPAALGCLPKSRSRPYVFKSFVPTTRGYLIVRGLPFAICRSLAQTPC